MDKGCSTSSEEVVVERIHRNIENNLFSGPFPPKLLTIPTFSKNGNPFNTTIIPLPLAAGPAPVAICSSPQESPWKMPHGPSALTTPVPASTRKSVIAKSVIWIAGAGLLAFIVLGVCLVMLRCIKRRPEKKNVKKLDDLGVFAGPLNKPKRSGSDVEAANQEEKVTLVL